MTLDDAIKHCYERAEELREKDGCLECAHEHEELAGWLEELKKWRELKLICGFDGYLVYKDVIWHEEANNEQRRIQKEER